MKHVIMMLRERRNSARHDIALDINASDQGVTPAAVLVEDISATGFRMVSGVPLITGDRINIDLPKVGERNATIVRQSGVRAGCAFTLPLTANELQQVVESVTEQMDERRQRAAHGWRPGAAALAA